jgi:Methyltransferase domain
MFEDAVWQMSGGERAAIEGVLSQLRPALAIEIGSAQGACLRRIAGHSGEVHSFDLSAPTLAQPDNVSLHTGDSHELLAPFLAGLAEQERNVDLVLVDGDHSPEGVRRDVEELLDSRALARTVILIHDTANEGVRQGLDAVRFAAWPKVAHVELDWIPGQLFAEAALRNELWYGIGLVLVDSSRLAYRNGSVYEQRYHSAAPLLAQIRKLVTARERMTGAEQTLADEADAMRQRSTELARQLAAVSTSKAELQTQLDAVQRRLDGASQALVDIKGSVSWRMTEPLRGAKRLAGRRPR